MAALGSYYRLTKPGIIYGNALAGLAGFGLALHGSWHVSTLISFVFGISLVMASACVANNIIDRNLDRAMERTKNRALVTGDIPLLHAGIYSAVLALLGFTILAVGTNWLTVFVGLLAFIDYVVLYAVAKRHTTLSTLVGSISGALPPVGGYVAVSASIDTNALLLFLAMTAWQMPHFYAIGMYRKAEYASAGLPLLTARTSRQRLHIHLIAYALLYIVANFLLWYKGTASALFMVVLTVLGAWWLQTIVIGPQTSYSDKWAKKIFKQSLLVLMVWCVLLILNNWLT